MIVLQETQLRKKVKQAIFADMTLKTRIRLQDLNPVKKAGNTEAAKVEDHVEVWQLMRSAGDQLAHNAHSAGSTAKSEK